MNIEEIIRGKVPRNLLISQDDADSFIKKNQLSEYYVGDFDFLSDHKTLRRGKKHLFIGTPGSGKTTLVRAIAFNVARKKKIMWYSSEENYDDMATALSFSKEIPESLRNVEFREESEFIEECKNDIDLFLEKIVKDFIESGCEVLFFDNITTSNFYELQSMDKQKEFFNKLSGVFEEIEKPLVLIAHTSAGVKDLQGDLFVANDIRGGKIPALKCEYIYAYQIINWKAKDESVSQFNIGAKPVEKKTAFIRVLKSRGHNNTGNVYKLNYDSDKRRYVDDRFISFETFKEIYDLRLRLK